MKNCVREWRDFSQRPTREQKDVRFIKFPALKQISVFQRAIDTRNLMQWPSVKVKLACSSGVGWKLCKNWGRWKFSNAYKKMLYLRVIKLKFITQTKSFPMIFLRKSVHFNFMKWNNGLSLKWKYFIIYQELSVTSKLSQLLIIKSDGPTLGLNQSRRLASQKLYQQVTAATNRTSTNRRYIIIGRLAYFVILY